jgi:hypothetical protein
MLNQPSGRSELAARLLGPNLVGTAMLDVIYILITVAFFAIMLLYVRACERLGRDTTDKTERTP